MQQHQLASFVLNGYRSEGRKNKHDVRVMKQGLDVKCLWNPQYTSCEKDTPAMRAAWLCHFHLLNLTLSMTGKRCIVTQAASDAVCYCVIWLQLLAGPEAYGHLDCKSLLPTMITVRVCDLCRVHSMSSWDGRLAIY